MNTMLATNTEETSVITKDVQEEIFNRTIEKVENKFGTFDPFSDRRTQYRYTKYAYSVYFKLTFARMTRAGENPAALAATYRNQMDKLNAEYQDVI